MKNLQTTLFRVVFYIRFPHNCYKAWGWYNTDQMKRQSKFLLILLCLSLLLFKAVSGNRFIENGIKRAEIYSNYSAYILAQQQVEASGIDDKNNLILFIDNIYNKFRTNNVNKDFILSMCDNLFLKIKDFAKEKILKKNDLNK